MRQGQFGEPLGGVAQRGRQRLRLGARRSVCGTGRWGAPRSGCARPRRDRRNGSASGCAGSSACRRPRRGLGVDTSRSTSALIDASSAVSVRPSPSVRGCRIDADAARLLQQQLADGQRARGGGPGRDRRGCRMVLRLAGDLVVTDDHAVDRHRPCAGFASARF